MRKFLLSSLLKALLSIGQKQQQHRSRDSFLVFDRDGREIYRERKPARSYFRYAKYAVMAGVLLLFLFGGLAIWGAIKAVNYAGDLFREQRPVAARLAESARSEWQSQGSAANLAEEQIRKGKEGAAKLINQPITTEACLGKVQEALNPSKWLTTPLAAQWNSFREACLERG